MIPKRMLDPTHWRDVLVASDPGLNRLRAASRATLTAAGSALILSSLSDLLHQNSRSSLVGVMVAMIGATTVNDPEPADQRRTMRLLPLVACTSILLGTLVAPRPLLSDMVFLSVIFGAVFVRRYDTRGTTLGMIAFLSFFFALFFHASLEQLPWLLTGIGIATALAYLIRFHLLPDRPERLLTSGLDAFQARVAALLNWLADATSTPRAWTRRRYLRYLLLIGRLNEAALGLEAQLQAPDDQPIAGGPTAWALRERIFELELSAESTAESIRRLMEREPPAEEIRESVARALRLTRRALRSERGATDAHADAELARALMALDPALEHPASRTLRRLRRSLETLREARQTLPPLRPDRSAPPAPDAPPATPPSPYASPATSPPAAPLPPDAPPAAPPPTDAPPSNPPPTDAPPLYASPAAPPPAAPPPAAPSPAAPPPSNPPPADEDLHPMTRQAIQAVIAGALAIAAGRAISPTRWYWAVAAAFVIFSQATTLGDTLSRAWQRVLGTLAGAVFGLVLASLVQGHSRLELTLMFVCIFLSFYMIRLFYAWFVMWFTMLLTLLYGLMGQLTPDLLELRLLQTVVGVGIGTLVATLVLPTHTHARVRAILSGILSELPGLLEQVLERPACAGSSRLAGGVEQRQAAPPELSRLARLEEVRELDRRLVELRQAARLLGGKLLHASDPDTARIVYPVLGLVFYARHLLLEEMEPCWEGPGQQAIQRIAGHLASNLAILAAVFPGGGSPGEAASVTEAAGTATGAAGTATGEAGTARVEAASATGAAASATGAAGIATGEAGTATGEAPDRDAAGLPAQVRPKIRAATAILEQARNHLEPRAEREKLLHWLERIDQLTAEIARALKVQVERG